jgi:CAAX prenyl protease-like protein
MAGVVERYPSVPYVAPFVLFLALTSAQAMVPGGIAVAYPAKTILVGLAIVALWRWLDLTGAPHWPLAVATGLALAVVWVLPEGLYPLLGEDNPYDPFAELTSTRAWTWLAFRVFGTAVIVPIVEEFFWRGFLIRWLIKADWRKVLPGTFTWYSFAATSVLFALEHHRWLVGLVAGVVFNLLYYRTRSLRACVLAHGVVNLALAVYVLFSGEWTFL